MASSNIDVTKPADNVKVSKADERAHKLVVKTEIEGVQRKTELPWLIAFGIQNV